MRVPNFRTFICENKDRESDKLGVVPILFTKQGLLEEVNERTSENHFNVRSLKNLRFGY